MPRRFLFPEAGEGSRSQRRGGTPHAYQDSFSQDKEDVNADLVYLRGPYRHDDGTHALYLDGKESRTTRALLQSGWPADKLHIPNSNRSDYDAIQRGNAGVNVYKRISTALHKEMARSPWVAHFRERKNRGPFSLVYLDYTTTTHRQADLKILLGDKLMTEGVLAIACPYRSPHIDVGRDNHVREEALNELDICNMAGLSVEGELAGLCKLRAEVESYASPGTRLSWLNARTYIGEGKHAQMWVGIYRVSPEIREIRDGDGGRAYDRSTPAGKEEEELDVMAYWLGAISLMRGHKASPCLSLLHEVRIIPLLDAVRIIAANGRPIRQMMSMWFVDEMWYPYHVRCPTVESRAIDQMMASWFVSVIHRERPRHRMSAYRLASMDGVREGCMAAERSKGDSVVLLPLLSALKRIMREFEREWDFKEYVYGRLAHDDMPSINAGDLATFVYWVEEYDMSTMKWQGDLDHLEGLLYHM